MLMFFFPSLSLTDFVEFKCIVACVIIDEILGKWTNYIQCPKPN